MTTAADNHGRHLRGSLATVTLICASVLFAWVISSWAAEGNPPEGDPCSCGANDEGTLVALNDQNEGDIYSEYYLSTLTGTWGGQGHMGAFTTVPGIHLYDYDVVFPFDPGQNLGLTFGVTAFYPPSDTDYCHVDDIYIGGASPTPVLSFSTPPPEEYSPIELGGSFPFMLRFTQPEDYPENSAEFTAIGALTDPEECAVDADQVFAFNCKCVHLTSNGFIPVPEVPTESISLEALPDDWARYSVGGQNRDYEWHLGSTIFYTSIPELEWEDVLLTLPAGYCGPAYCIARYDESSASTTGSRLNGPYVIEVRHDFVIYEVVWDNPAGGFAGVNLASLPGGLMNWDVHVEPVANIPADSVYNWWFEHPGSTPSSGEGEPITGMSEHHRRFTSLFIEEAVNTVTARVNIHEGPAGTTGSQYNNTNGQDASEGDSEDGLAYDQYRTGQAPDGEINVPEPPEAYFDQNTTMWTGTFRFSDQLVSPGTYGTNHQALPLSATVEDLDDLENDATDSSSVLWDDGPVDDAPGLDDVTWVEDYSNGEYNGITDVEIDIPCGFTENILTWNITLSVDDDAPPEMADDEEAEGVNTATFRVYRDHLARDINNLAHLTGPPILSPGNCANAAHHAHDGVCGTGAVLQTPWLQITPHFTVWEAERDPEVPATTDDILGTNYQRGGVVIVNSGHQAMTTGVLDETWEYNGVILNEEDWGMSDVELYAHVYRRIDNPSNPVYFGRGYTPVGGWEGWERWTVRIVYYPPPTPPECP